MLNSIIWSSIIWLALWEYICSCIVAHLNNMTTMLVELFCSFQTNIFIVCLSFRCFSMMPFQMNFSDIRYQKIQKLPFCLCATRFRLFKQLASCVRYVQLSTNEPIRVTSTFHHIPLQRRDIKKWCPYQCWGENELRHPNIRPFHGRRFLFRSWGKKKMKS